MIIQETTEWASESLKAKDYEHKQIDWSRVMRVQADSSTPLQTSLILH